MKFHSLSEPHISITFPRGCHKSSINRRHRIQNRCPRAITVVHPSQVVQYRLPSSVSTWCLDQSSSSWKVLLIRLPYSVIFWSSHHGLVFLIPRLHRSYPVIHEWSLMPYHKSKWALSICSAICPYLSPYHWSYCVACGTTLLQHSDGKCGRINKQCRRTFQLLQPWSLLYIIYTI